MFSISITAFLVLVLACFFILSLMCIMQIRSNEVMAHGVNYADTLVLLSKSFTCVCAVAIKHDPGSVRGLYVCMHTHSHMYKYPLVYTNLEKA